MNHEQEQLEKLYQQYEAQIKKDLDAQLKVAQRIAKKFAPFKTGDRVTWITPWLNRQKFGIVYECTYGHFTDWGKFRKWEVAIMPTNQDFSPSKKERSFAFPDYKTVRKVKDQ